MTLVDTARAWMASDPDPATRAQTEAMLDDPGQLARFFGAPLSFGTAGLRGPIGPGPGGMNRANVRRVSAGLGQHLRQTHGNGTVVVGFDGRRGSRVFAEDTAAVLIGLGFTVQLFDDVCPTPNLAHAVLFSEAIAGVMVTASHNPPDDNGYKVYAANGAQIVPPMDADIAARIADVDLAAVAVPELPGARVEGRLRSVPAEARTDYEERVAALRVHALDGAGLRVVYTAMHGVGTASIQRVLGAAGYEPILVEEQAWPDGDFPTVEFPNPEEPGALDLAIARADAVGADLIVANDPDADRLAVVVRHAGGWRQLTGNQVGCLLAEDLLTHGHGDRPRMVATTIVSSTLLSRIAAAHDVTYTECLTGFKWIANAAIPFDAGGGQFVIGYEEALGYSAGDIVRDKDGVSATLLLCDLANRCKRDGGSLLDAVERLYRKYGVHSSRQIAVRHVGAAGAARIRSMMEGLRGDGFARVGDIDVSAVTDVLAGTRVDLASGEQTTVNLPSSNVLAWHLVDGSRILARPSGTEPKIKFYFEVVEPMSETDTLEAAEARADARLDALQAAFTALQR